MTSELENVNVEITILRERETAMREILQVISASQTDPAPVFDTILKNASRLSGAPLANLCILNETRSYWNLVAHYGEGLRHLTVGKTTRLSDSNLVPAQTMRTASIVHIENLMETDLYQQGDPGRVAMVKEEGMRTILGVPLLLDGRAIGCMTLFRREVKAFTQDEIELVETFAAQAVIAVENVRQFCEVQERLEREIATGQILAAISRSRADTAPIFEEILESAARLCRAPMAWLLLRNADRNELQLAAYHGPTRRALKIGQTWPLTPDRKITGLGQALLNALTVQDEDLTQVQGYRRGDPDMVQLVDEEGLRTRLSVPLVRDGQSIGAIVLSRREVSRFSDEDVRLADTFAAQAVIAIENVRQFRELQERLERERASAEILEVISQSRDDDRPVFDIILKNAAQLCKASNANLTLVNAARDKVSLVASHGRSILSLVVGESEWNLKEAMSVAEALSSRKPIHIPDYAATESYKDGSNKLRVRLVDENGIRASLAVPLMSVEGPIGTLMLHRDEPVAFTEAEINLATSFAAQAVIAIENVRQFQALETLNAELGERVDEQVGEIERMGRLKRFLPSAVADAVVTAGDESLLSSHRALVATMFCDMRGFTAFCEAAEPEETIEVLQTYHQEMSALIDRHGGGVDQRAGDGIMVIFNDPIQVDDPAGDAVQLALAMRRQMRELCAKWKKLGHRLGFGIGISFGYATVGLVGSAGRYDYTASGTSINTAARLCDMAANDEILISPRTWAAIEGTFEAESRGEVKMKGIREPVEIFAVLSE